MLTTATTLFDTAGRTALLVGTVAVFTAPFPSAFVLLPANACNDAGPTPAVGENTVTTVV